MKKKLLIILLIPLLILIKLLYTYTVNEIIIANYNKDNYNTSLIKSLYFINYPESYIAYYNHGNILYKTKDYNEAVIKYEEALELNPPENRICEIRINLSLSMVANIDKFDSNALSKIKEARKVLYKDSCANENDNNGDSKDAEELEEEIKKLEKELENSSGEDEDPNQPNSEDNNNQEEERNIEEELREIQRDANRSRQEDISEMENEYNFDRYDNKRW